MEAHKKNSIGALFVNQPRNNASELLLNQKENILI